jgi:glycosyltransferase involved in cell wall biosynthesis
MPILKDYDIVCFSNDWDGDPLSKTHLMRLAARRNRVLWVNSVGNRAPRATARDLKRLGHKLLQALEGLREVEPGIHVLAPLAVPLFGQSWVQELNGRVLELQLQAAMNRLGMTDPLAISFLPGAAPAFARLQAQLHVYYCVDEFAAFEGAGDAIAQQEKSLIAHSDLVICSSERLQRAKERLHPRVALVRHGVDLQHFRRATDSTLPLSGLMRDLPRPVLGFVGLIANWVDQELLGAVAEHFAAGTLVLVGREDCDTTLLRTHPNIVFLGRRPYAELPSIMKGFDVGLVAFRENELTDASNPLKAREYVAAGLPVVSTPIPEVERLGVCHIARGSVGFIEAIEGILASGAGPASTRSATMASHSWEARWNEVESLIAEQLGLTVTRRHVG